MSGLQQTFDLDKPLYTISIASEILDTHPRTLMLYEEVGLITPFRTATNRRRYSQRDLRKLQVIQYLTRELTVNLAGVRCILGLFKAMSSNDEELPRELREAYERYTAITEEPAGEQSSPSDASRRGPR
ncbi:MAG TPA: MerR family transcriptional regulator [Candidatus Dormibacteraeota bacterium]|jgi:MerR family transcriptional regulator/heat shock protein HspR|nr:MerR family transcriptional regulator [Candidatus Dormibacteraeota bacterium]